ncbi:hypothetical protein [Catellatospora chokoriensis]|uniref:hypothetical protein n=1 Tax=Catellatospora chokoriensis TaxID=310353 RepID=UPI00177D637A|nr:hypothetical protein [Catellatospora chokoriensis]
MDWLGTITTAVVGVVGITATVWGGRSDRRARERTSWLDEKRRAYVKLFAAGDHWALLIRECSLPAQKSGDQPGARDRALSQLPTALVEFNTVFYEFALIASKDVVARADALFDILNELSDSLTDGSPSEGYQGRRIVIARRLLLDAMRADLGATKLLSDSM